MSLGFGVGGWRNWAVLGAGALLLLGSGACSDSGHDLGGSGGAAGNAGNGGTGGNGGSAGSSGGSGGSVAGSGGGGSTPCEQAGGTVIDADCCAGTADFPNLCLVGACGCAPQNSESIKICDCPGNGCWDGTKCSDQGLGGAGGGGAGGSGGSGGSTGGTGGASDGCVQSGGVVGQSLCCAGAGDFPSMCSVGVCGCSPDNSEMVQVCECPQGSCFDGLACRFTN